MRTLNLCMCHSSVSNARQYGIARAIHTHTKSLLFSSWRFRFFFFLLWFNDSLHPWFSSRNDDEWWKYWTSDRDEATRKCDKWITERDEAHGENIVNTAMHSIYTNDSVKVMHIVVDDEIPNETKMTATVNSEHEHSTAYVQQFSRHMIENRRGWMKPQIQQQQIRINETRRKWCKRKRQDRARMKNIVQGSRSLLDWMGMKETQFEIGEHCFERVSNTKRNAEKKIGSSRKTRRLQSLPSLSLRSSEYYTSHIYTIL